MEGGQEFIKPLDTDKKKGISLWKKLAILIPVVFLVSWTIAMWNPLEDKEDDANLIRVGSYDFYEMQEGLFGTSITLQGQQALALFRLDPREAGDINLDDRAIEEILNSRKLYLTYNPNHGNVSKIVVAAGEIARILGLYQLNVVTAYSEDSNPINPNVPVKTCADVDENTGVIFVDSGDEIGITMKDGCVVINGETADETILAADKLGMNLIGIRL